MNRVVMSGNLTRKAELKRGQATTYARTALAVDRRDGTDFFNVVSFGKAAERLSEYEKGEKIALWGRLRTGKYEKNGQTVTTFEIIAEGSEMLGKRENFGGDESEVEPEDTPF